MRKTSISPMSPLSGTLRGHLWGVSAVAAALALSATGCGDGPICPTDIVIVITTPVADSDVLADLDDTAPGVQVDVRVRSNLLDGESFTLIVTGADGADERYEAESDAEGDVLFENVTVPDGAVTLRVEGGNEDCGDGVDQISINVAAGAGCVLTIREEPIENDYYSPLLVLNASNDADAEMANFQANVDVESFRDYEVELFVLDVDAATENSAGTVSADADGAATFAITLAQGRQAVRAVCMSPAATANPSITTTVFVDTEAPACTVTYPPPGQTLIPELDEDTETAGLQLSLEGQAVSGSTDVAGEAATFSVDGPRGQTDLIGSDLDVEGYSSAETTLEPDSASASYDLTFASQDHAGNACSVTETYAYEQDGCSIVVTAPTSVVSDDADGNPSNGVQVDVTVEVGAACVGEIVTSDCGDNDPSGTVPAGGELTLRVDLCEGATCEVTEVCQLAVTSPSGIDTSAGANIQFDNLAPTVTLIWSNPPIACNSQITPSDDVAGGTPGVQLDVIVGAPGAVLRQVEVTPEGGSTTTVTTAGNGTARITVEGGDNDVIATAVDAAGNQNETGPCNIRLADLAVSFSPPVADGLVGAQDGSVSGSDLTLDICGTMSDAAAAVTLSFDGGAFEAAIESGTTWCLNNRTLSEGDHTIVVEADTGSSFGTTTLDLTVDLSAPAALVGFAAFVSTRQSLAAQWDAPADAVGYVVKVSTTALTAGNFASTGTEIPSGAPGAPGSPESITAGQLRAGTPHWMGVAAVDAAGNVSTPSIDGPMTPAFDQTGALLPANTTGNVRLGVAVARGRFNADSFDDLAVSAPGTAAGVGAVYIYLGSAGGVSATPDVTISGTDAAGQFGSALATVRWSSAVYDDLVVGVFGASSATGKVYVFDGGSGLDAGSYTTAAADLTIGVNPSANWFTGSFLGYSLAAADFDGDNTDDLAIGAPGGNSGEGGVAILYGGTATGPAVNLSNLTATQMSNAVVELIRAPEADAFQFAQVITNLGPTMGNADDNDDLAVSYTENDSVFVFRGTGVVPVTAGVHERPFAVGTDLKIDSGSIDTDADFGSSMGSISDHNGDGARDLVIGAFQEGATNAGRVLIVDGNSLGNGSGVANALTTAGFVITTITPAGAGALFGAGVVNNAVSSAPDIDGDGAEDLVISGRPAGATSEVMFVWFGGSIPTGATTTASANHSITAPSTITGLAPSTGGSGMVTIWAGDVNADGLEDICWANFNGNTQDGSFEVLWDDGF